MERGHHARIAHTAVVSVATSLSIKESKYRALLYGREARDPFFHVVDRKIYEQAKAKWLEMKDTPFYSEALRNSM
jgi:hypothetical protein